MVTIIKKYDEIFTKRTDHLKVIEKAECASKAVVELSTRIYNKQTQDFFEEEKNNLKNGKIKNGNFSYGKSRYFKICYRNILKKTLQVFDVYNDIEISGDEIKGFFKS